jgi:hypothetical protein
MCACPERHTSESHSGPGQGNRKAAVGRGSVEGGRHLAHWATGRGLGNVAVSRWVPGTRPKIHGICRVESEISPCLTGTGVMLDGTTHQTDLRNACPPG